MIIKKKPSRKIRKFATLLMSKFSGIEDYRGYTVLSTINSMMEGKNVDFVRCIDKKSIVPKSFVRRGKTMLEYSCCGITVPYDSQWYYKFCPNCGRAINIDRKDALL